VSDLEQLEFDDSMCCMPKNIGMLFFKQSLQVVHLAVMHSYFQTYYINRKVFDEIRLEKHFARYKILLNYHYRMTN